MSAVMKGFLYFLPGGDRATRERLEAEGLGYVFDGLSGPGPEFSGMTPGPDGHAGVVFSVAGLRGRGAPSATLAGEARWTSIPGSNAWLGTLEDALPGPQDLARYDQIDGHDVPLGDASRWRVPVVRLLSGDTRLPRALEWDGSDWKKGDVRPAYRKLWAAGLRIFDTLLGASDGEPVTLTEEATTAAAALALNYRIGPAEVSALGLLDTRSEVEVLKAMIDMPALGALRGKAGAATPS